MRFLRRENGNVLIEISLILPVIILMMLGVLNFGLLLQQYMRVADSARAGAQAAALRVNATNYTFIQQVASGSASGIPGYSVVATSYCACAPGSGNVSCSSHSNCGSYGIPNQYIQVTATASLPLLFKMSGVPTSYSVKSVAIARTAWTGTN